MRDYIGRLVRPTMMHERLSVVRQIASSVLPLLFFAVFQRPSQILARSVEPASFRTFDYLLSTATVTLYPCASLTFMSPVMPPCPAASPPGAASAIVSIVACSGTEEEVSRDSQTSLAPSIGNNESCHNDSPDESCQVAHCPCENDDDDDCAACESHRSHSFSCTSTSVQIANHNQCVKLTSHILAHMLSSKMARTAGHYSQAFDRIVFKLGRSISADAHATPPLGPWVFGSLHRWHLAHASEDDHLATIDAQYHLVTLGSQWPDAKCLDGTKGAYYMCVICSCFRSVQRCNTICIMPARSEASRLKWRVFLEGGGWCTGDDDCALRSKVRAAVIMRRVNDHV
jgi:hypothetical protein